MHIHYKGVAYDEIFEANSIEEVIELVVIETVWVALNATYIKSQMPVYPSPYVINIKTKYWQEKG